VTGSGQPAFSIISKLRLGLLVVRVRLI
jgi:hypothetical protein